MTNLKKSSIHGFKVGGRVETSVSYYNRIYPINKEGAYHSRYIKIISPSLPNSMPGSMITFTSEQSGEIQSIHESNLESYQGLIFKDGKVLTHSTIEDVLNNASDESKINGGDK